MDFWKEIYLYLVATQFLSASSKDSSSRRYENWFKTPLLFRFRLNITKLVNFSTSHTAEITYPCKTTLSLYIPSLSSVETVDDADYLFRTFCRQQILGSVLRSAVFNGFFLHFIFFLDRWLFEYSREPVPLNFHVYLRQVMETLPVVIETKHTPRSFSIFSQTFYDNRTHIKIFLRFARKVTDTKIRKVLNTQFLSLKKRTRPFSEHS